MDYKTSATLINGRPVDMLHDFYIPALQRSIKYDRVAGYFRSSSLAAASLGFSAFVGRKGKMRLIVGADLDPHDVKAILEGDRQRLAMLLNEELKEPEAWPAEVQNGVTLLAWMVAHGYLEVRVAFRVHKDTGEPLSFEDTSDGYVHEKWFIFEDEFGDKIYGAGALNESKTAFILNAENFVLHCSWYGGREAMRVEKAQQEFEDLWHNRFAHMKVLTLPEAVRQRLIVLARGANPPVEVDGTFAGKAWEVAPAPSAIERLRFAVLRYGPRMPGGRYVGLETAPVAPWPHQAVVARRLVESWPYSYLLCDEVGLGKTIEAGLALRSLFLSGLVKRVLIACPASLTKQWQRQMASKVLMSFGLVRTVPGVNFEYVFPFEDRRAGDSLFEENLIIISTGLLARRERWAQLATAEPFDVALIDEAHAARRQNPSAGLAVQPEYAQLYIAIREYLREKSRCLWLATATPMQIHPVEAWDLLTLTNRVGAFQYDPTVTLEYYRILGELVQGHEPNEDEWELLRRAIGSVQIQDPFLWHFLWENVIDSRIRLAVNRWLRDKHVPKGWDRRLMLRLMFMASPLSRVMFRNTRKLLEVYREKGQLQQNLAIRHIMPLPEITFNEFERQIAKQLEEYCHELAKRVGQQGDRQAVSFLASFLRLRFASSLYALRETLKRRLAKIEAALEHQSEREMEEDTSLAEFVFDQESEDDKVAVESLLQNRSVEDLEWERDQLSKMISFMADLTANSSKMKVLLEQLDRRQDRKTGRIKQTVIFTRFFDTLQDIVRRLRRADRRILLGVYSGQEAGYYTPYEDKLIKLEREEVKERFLRGEIDVLVCTDAAAEGLNLQTADLLINYDLGWNPMKIEQRIGRIDRIGQKHQRIYVLNLCYLGSAEEIVYNRLLKRLSEANLIVGTQQISLLPVEPEDFRQLAEGSLTPEELEVKVRERLVAQRQRTESMEISAEELYEIYQRMNQETNGISSPVTLEDIWATLVESEHLRSLGCEIIEQKGRQGLKISGIPGVPADVVLTVSRELYEEGLADGTAKVHFASYGDPFFDAVLDYFSQYDLPTCITKLTVPVPGLEGVEVVAFAAVCQEPGGVRKAVLIRSWRDLKGLQLAEGERINETELRELRLQLEREVQQEFYHYLSLQRVEHHNIRVAAAHEAIILLAAKN
ncbi:MAG TPA: helicase-related protein, partial [Oculatellaceae cyanobacterium]